MCACVSKDEFTEVKTTSRSERKTPFIVEIIFGLIAFICAFPFLWKNEARSVNCIKTIREGKKIVISVPVEKIDPLNNEKLVHVSGRVTTDEILKDKLFGVQEKVLKLKRIVKMYQWHERKEEKNSTRTDSTTTTTITYSYYKDWSDSLIDSSKFKIATEHSNPLVMTYESLELISPCIRMGAFKVGECFIKEIQSFLPYPLSRKNFEAMDEKLKKDYKFIQGKYYRGDVENPKVGDLCIAYETIRPTEISIIGRQTQGSIEEYNLKNGTIKLLQPGRLNAAEMFEASKLKNTLLTWELRFFGFFLMWWGFCSILKPIKILCDLIPFLGGFFGVLIRIGSFIVSLALSLATIAIAWLFCRPLFSILLLAFIGGFLFTKNKANCIKKFDLDCAGADKNN